jgi:hypothetical protein
VGCTGRWTTGLQNNLRNVDRGQEDAAKGADEEYAVWWGRGKKVHKVVPPSGNFPVTRYVKKSMYLRTLHKSTPTKTTRP